MPGADNCGGTAYFSDKVINATWLPFGASGAAGQLGSASAQAPARSGTIDSANKTTR